MLELKYNESVLSFTDGITATSANHLCNVAKETYAEIEERHKNIRFYNKKIESLSSTPKVLSYGNDETYLGILKEDLKVLSDLKSFIAYFKEVIKLKEKLYKTYQGQYYVCEHTEPKRPTKISLDEYLTSLPIKEYQRYFNLETKCAVYGSFVHPDGGFSKARKTLFKLLNNPTDVSQSNSETLITSYEATIDLNNLDSTFFEIQKEHRRCQAEFNKFKSDIETKLDNDYQAEFVKYNQAYEEFRTLVTKQRHEFELQQEAVLQQIQKLKIIIPDNLKDIYTLLSSK